MKILIFGVSGSGATTLGRELGKLIQYVHLDSDDYYWKKTEPPPVLSGSPKALPILSSLLEFWVSHRIFWMTLGMEILKIFLR